MCLCDLRMHKQTCLHMRKQEKAETAKLLDVNDQLDEAYIAAERDLRSEIDSMGSFEDPYLRILGPPYILAHPGAGTAQVSPVQWSLMRSMNCVCGRNGISVPIFCVFFHTPVANTYACARTQQRRISTSWRGRSGV